MLGGSRYGRSEDSSLCLCEYYNHSGERSHMLACCCDCQALDTVCDRWLTCRPVESGLYERMWLTITDRLRIPTLSGKGAVRVHPDVALPALLVPLSLMLATINEYWTLMTLVALPLAIFIHYRLWLRSKRRTRIFYVWGVVSVVLMMVVFVGIVVEFREILLWEILTELSLFAGLMYSWYQVKQNPGYIKAPVKYNNDDKREDEDFTFHTDNQDEDKIKEQIAESRQLERQKREEGTIHEHEVTWVDSRPFSDKGYLQTWCVVCQVERSARSGHCNVCSACVLGRDHHCVWIDACIGARNHRAFYMGLVLLLLTGFYGSHLTLTTVCTPSMYWDWLLMPHDCHFVYSDLPTALCFVSACYTLIFTTFMFTVCLHQSLLISQNITSQELHHASVRGWTTFVVWARNNVNNRGFLINWRDFLTGRRARKHRYDTL